MSKLNDLEAKKTRMIAEAQVLVNDGKAATEEYRTLLSEIDGVAEHIRLLKMIEVRMPSVQSAAVTSPAAPTVIRRDEPLEETRQRLNTAFRSLLKNGYNPHLPEQRNLSVSAEGSATIPADVFPVLGEVTTYYAPLLDYVTVEQKQPGYSTKFITETDSTNFLTVSSEGSTPVETDQTFSDTVKNYDLLTGNVKASLQLIDDSRFDITQLITRAAGRRLGKSYEAILVNGTDPASNPAPNNQGLANAAAVGTTTATLAAGIGMADLTNLVESLDPSRWSKAVFLLSGGTYQYLMKQVDGSGRRFWEELGEGRLWQWPVVICNALPQTFTANGIPVLFGDLSTYGVSHTGLSLQVLFERYIDQFKRGFQLSSQIASQQLVPGGIKALKLAAS